jgi:hypothetical protein
MHYQPIAQLARLALKAKNETARIAAIRELLDRGYGRPGQAMEVSLPGADPLDGLRLLMEEIDAIERKRTVRDRLLAGKPLSPLTGAESEWLGVGVDPKGGPVFQNKRCGTVFKDADGRCYHIDTPGARLSHSMPAGHEIKEPIFEVEYREINEGEIAKSPAAGTYSIENTEDSG